MTEQQEITSECRHHWMIDSPNGPTSRGECTLCGERAEFKNSIPISGWDRAGAANRRAKQLRR